MSARSYVEAIKAMELKVLAEADLGYYQGDWVGLVKNEAFSYDGQDYGVIVVGYGSCSGCDEWQATGDPAKRAELVAKLLRDAKWFAELDEAKAYVADPDRALEFYSHEDGWPAFVEAAQKASEW